MTDTDIFRGGGLKKHKTFFCWFLSLLRSMTVTGLQDQSLRMVFLLQVFAIMMVICVV